MWLTLLEANSTQHDRDGGAVALEYVLVATLIAVVAAVGVRALGLSVTALLDTAIALF